MPLLRHASSFGRNFEMKKSIAFILTLAIAFSAMLGIVSSAADGAPALEISYAMLEFGNAPYLYIAVDYSDFGSYEGVTLRVTNNNTNATHIYEPRTDITAPEGCIAFKYTATSYKSMGDELTLQAMKDGNPCGEAKTYSVLEYALKAQTVGNQKLTELLVAMLNFGAKAQIALDYPGTYNLSKTYSLVEVEGGTVNRKNKIIVERGTKVTATFTSGATSSLTTDGPYHLIKAQ